jgi:hypothetical protein
MNEESVIVAAKDAIFFLKGMNTRPYNGGKAGFFHTHFNKAVCLKGEKCTYGKLSLKRYLKKTVCCKLTYFFLGIL